MNSSNFLFYIYRSICYILCILGIASSFYVFSNPLPTVGTELYFLLPLTYAFLVLVYKDVFEYHIDGFGIKCFLIVTLVRYVILPFYSSYCGEIGTYRDLNSSFYEYAIFIQLLEIIVSYSVINYYYRKEYIRIKANMRNTPQFYNSLGLGGLFVGIALVGVVVLRGHLGAVIELARFLVVTDKFDETSDYWTYDIWAIQIFFAYIVVTITSFFMKKNDKKDSWLNVLIPLILAFLSCSIILTNNRMTMVYYALSGLCVLNAAFPKKSKTLSLVMISVMFTVIVSFTLMKNFGVDISSSSGTAVSEDEGASALSAYVCGIDNIAHTCDMHMRNGSLYGVDNFFAMLFRFFMPSRLPFLNSFGFNGTPTAVDLACEGTEMVSVAGETMFWGGGMFFGWILDLVTVYVITRLLLIFEIRTKLEQDLGKKYIFNWLSVLFGIYMCYCVQTLWNNTTYMPIFLGVALMINRKFRIKKTIILRND